MTRLRRRWRTLRWAGLAVSLLIFIAWAASLSWNFGYLRLHTDPTGVIRTASGSPVFSGELVGGCLSTAYLGPWPRRYSEWHIYRNDDSVRWLPSSAGGAFLLIQVPLWIPFLITAVPTVLLWWFGHRRIPPGHCQKCGYNLTGNVSGVCPECGQEVPPQHSDRQDHAF
jgi:hypothetical protein